MAQNENAVTWFVDRHVTDGHADKLAFREAAGHKRSLSYGELADQTARAAGAYARADIRREERALLLVLDQLEFLPPFWGALKCGVIPVPLNTMLGTPVYEAILRDSRAACLFVSQELWPVAIRICSRSRRRSPN